MSLLGGIDNDVFEADALKEYYWIDETWCGRYVLIIGDYIFLDANGLYGAFFTDNAISSSISLLGEIEGVPVKNADIVHGVLPDWYPGPLTPCKTIKRLLPSQIYNYARHEIYERPLLNKKYQNLGLDSLYKAIIDRYGISLSNMEKCIKGKYKVALTSGKDSRLSLVMLSKSDIAFSTFTLEHDLISEDDINIPPLLANKLNTNHIYVKRDKADFSKDRLKVFDQFTAKFSQDEDRLFLHIISIKTYWKRKRSLLS